MLRPPGRCASGGEGVTCLDPVISVIASHGEGGVCGCCSTPTSWKSRIGRREGGKGVRVLLDADKLEESHRAS